MIAANDLRQNNLLRDVLNGEIVNVLEVLADGVSTINRYGINYGFLEPIPLTEEWLLRFEFEINKTYCSKKINKTNEFDIMIFDDGWLLCDCDIHCKIKYVHQLQNVWFSLTGEELTIKD